MRSRDSLAHRFKQALHGSIPFFASLILLLLSWFNRQTWILWELTILSAVLLFIPIWRSLSNESLAPISIKRSFFLYFIGCHFQTVTFFIESIYHDSWHKPLALWPKWVLAILFSSALLYHNLLKERAINRGYSALSCWSFESQTPSVRRLVLFLSHYSAANGLFCFFTIILITAVKILFPHWWAQCFSISLPLFVCIGTGSVIFFRLLCVQPNINQFVGKYSVLFLCSFFLFIIGTLHSLQGLDVPSSFFTQASLLNQWLATPLMSSIGGDILTLGAALSSVSIFILGALQVIKTQISQRLTRRLLWVEGLLWIAVIISCFAWPRLYYSDLSIGSVRYTIAYSLSFLFQRLRLNHPIGLIFLSLPLYSGLIRRCQPKSIEYVFLGLGLLTPLSSFITEPIWGLILLLILIIANLATSRHILYACDASWERCNRTLIKGTRWVFPLSFSIWALLLNALLLPSSLIFIVLENFGLLFVFSLILITLLEVFLALEEELKSWYSKKHHSPVLLTQ